MTIEESTRRHVRINASRSQLDEIRAKLAKRDYDEHTYIPKANGQFYLHASKEISAMGEVSDAFMLYPEGITPP